MTIREQISNIEVRHGGEGHYHDGFYHARDEAFDIAYNADRLIEALFDALCDRHADDVVDELKAEFNYE